MVAEQLYALTAVHDQYEDCQSAMYALHMVNLAALMDRMAGRPEVIIGLIDGPVATDHPDLASTTIKDIRGASGAVAVEPNNGARAHGTFVAGILSARRGSPAPAICPGCTLLVRPIFLGMPPVDAEMPSATPDALAEAIIECVVAGTHVLNLSVALAQPMLNKEGRLEEALHYAAGRGTLVVAAAGNQGTLGSSAITRHPWVIPVAACDLQGRPMGISNLGSSIGRRGLSAPGEAITSLGVAGQPITSGGTSAATLFVTGTIALLGSAFPDATAAEVKSAVTRTATRRRTTVVPPVLDARAAYQVMVKAYRGGQGYE
jgi:subtilisin family serine protease